MGTENTFLWDSSADANVIRFNNAASDTLGSTCKENLTPFQKLVIDGISLDFLQKTTMLDCIQCFANVQIEDIDQLPRTDHPSPFLHFPHQLREEHEHPGVKPCCAS